MIKALLNYFFKISLFTSQKDRGEIYLSQSKDHYDLDQRIKNLDKENI